MNEEIRVSVFRRSGRRFWYMQYRDPVTGDKVVQSTKTTKRREAERKAAKWERDVREGRDNRRGRMPWEDFRERYESEVLAGLADRTDAKVAAVFNVLEKLMRPKRLADVNTDCLSRYQEALRKAGRTESTIKGHLAHIMSALNWAADRGLIMAAPKVKMPKRAKRSKVMKGRPITTEEFERMLSHTVKALATPLRDVKDCRHKGKRKWSEKTRAKWQAIRDKQAAAVADSWRFYLSGLWWSGLRLAESMELHWTVRSKLCVVDLDGREPMLWIPADLEKGHKDRLLPMAPEFAEFLRRVAPAARKGFVFDPRPLRSNGGERLSAHHVGIVVARIGKVAGVKVDTNPKTGKVQFASAHDLRRSFGERWAARVMPQVLMELMRHESIDTTLRYYVGHNAKRTAGVLWDAYRALPVGATMGATSETGPAGNEETPSQVLAATGFRK